MAGLEELRERGTVRPITRWGEPVMHRTCRQVRCFDEELASLVADMVATLRAADGAGLAANQIGVDLQVFVYSCTDADQVLHEGVLCNPVLELPSGEDRTLAEDEEGCLSLPGAWAPCARPDHATARGMDETGTPQRIEGTGILARCLQHETDHLNGIVFGDRLSNRLRKRLYADAADVAEEHPSSWPATETI